MQSRHVAVCTASRGNMHAPHPFSVRPHRSWHDDNGDAHRNDVEALGRVSGLARLSSLGPPRWPTNCSNSGLAQPMHWRARGPASPPSRHSLRRLWQPRQALPSLDAPRPPKSSTKRTRSRTRLVPPRPLQCRPLAPETSRLRSSAATGFTTRWDRCGSCPPPRATGPANGGSRPDTSACEHYLTPLASPAGSPRQRLRPGEAAPTQAEEATPGFTPPPSPPAPHAPPRWQDARPPSAQPGDRNSWLFVPLLHTAAGNLSEQALAAWRSLPDDAAGRFDALAHALQAAPPAEPSCLARLLHSIAECDAEEAGEAPPGIPATDAALATSLRALPAAPIPLATALLLARPQTGTCLRLPSPLFWRRMAACPWLQPLGL